MNSSEIRNAFLNYFKEKGHQQVNSASLVPEGDDTLLFTNAGMNQFKNVFLDLESRNYTRATTSQKCVRAGGKHNDLDNVGYTARHHTFFEMLGNFSFGDYFKQDAIKYAWDFLTNTLKLSPEKLLVTVYKTDDESYNIWKNEIGLADDKIIRIGDKSSDKPFESDNFWQMGDTGPCGPCTEIFYDHGEHIWGDKPGTKDEDGDRYIEIWNIVFMQYNRQTNGEMHKLPKPCVDTGMGLERISAIMQNVHSNYEIDIFQNLINTTAKLLAVSDLNNKSLRVIADHIRSCSFLILDGVLPSNEGRGYVLRRIIRRAVRHGHKLGTKDVFFYKLLDELITQMSDAYPKLKHNKAKIEKVLVKEERQFNSTLDKGLAILNEELANLKTNKLDGNFVFKMYDTYGFPVDLTADIAREKNFIIDELGFEKAMQEQRDRAKQASQFGTDYTDKINTDLKSEFIGYDYKRLREYATVLAIYHNNELTNNPQSGQELVVILDKTPFYAESGGQLGDRGEMQLDGKGRFVVKNTTKLNNAIIHHGYLEGSGLETNKKVFARVDSRSRWNRSLNHSVTHLLHEALVKTVGDHVQQKGSLVDADKLRFDFSHDESLSLHTLHQIEHLVNQQIRRNLKITTESMTIEKAKQTGAKALFSEKYSNDVRVVKMGDFSTELCGGTHAYRTGDIGFFKITNEFSISSGIRRIEAVTGQYAIDLMHKLASDVGEVAGMLKGDSFTIVDRVYQALERSKSMERELEKLKSKLATKTSSDILSKVKEINGIKVLVAKIDNIDAKSLRLMADDLKVKLEHGILLLATTNETKVSLIAGVTKNLTSTIKAGDLVNYTASFVDGKGGGRPDMAQAGGTNPQKLDKALELTLSWLTEKL